MELSKQLCSPESAKRLKELGVKQESLFVWIDVTDNYNVKPELCKKHPNQQDKKGTYGGNGFKHQGEWEQKYYSAFTVAELGEMLPGEINGEYLSCYRVHLLHGTTDEHDEWECGYGKALNGKFFAETTEAEARAKMLIYLLENKLITL